MNDKTFSRGSRMLQASRAVSTPKRKPVSTASTLLVTQPSEEPMDCDDESDIRVIHHVIKAPNNDLKVTVFTPDNNEGVALRKRFSEKENRNRPRKQLETVHLEECVNARKVVFSRNDSVSANKTAGTYPCRPVGASQTSLPSVPRETSSSRVDTGLASTSVLPSSKQTLCVNNFTRLSAYNADELKKQQDFAILEIIDTPPVKSTTKSSPVRQPLGSEVNKRSRVSNTLLPKNASSFYGSISPKMKRFCARVESPYAFLGLQNIGESCYMNAALQLLLVIAKFVKLLEVVEGHPFDASPSSAVVSCLLEIIKCRLEKAKISAQCLHKLLTSAGKQFKLNQQADSHEFLVAVLTHVKEFCQKVEMQTLPTSIFEFVKSEESVCRRCDWSSRTSSTNSCVILSVDDCLGNSERNIFNGVMNITNRRNVPCSSCSADAENRTVDEGHSASLVSEWDRFPEYLLINLSRTERRDSFTRKSEVEVLVNNLMVFGAAEPFPKLPVTPFSLVACILHKGTSFESGHYVSWIRYGKEWLCCDDDHVTSADINSSHVSKDGCVFLYKRNEF